MTSRNLVGVLAMVVLTSLFGHVDVAGQTAVQFSAADIAAKRRMLDDISSQRASVTGPELRAILEQGVQNPDASLRRRALLAIASCAGGPRFVNNNETKTRWRADRPTIEGLRPAVRTALRDNNALVRQAAVIALGNMEYDLDRPDLLQTLDDGFVSDLLATYNAEPVGRVREEIMKAFALSLNDSPQLRDIVGKGLDDEWAGVRGFAATAAGRFKRPEDLQKLVALLQNDRVGVRLEAAKALRSYGLLAALRLDELKAVSANETNKLIGEILTLTIKDLEGRK